MRRSRDDESLDATLEHQPKVGALVTLGLLLEAPDDQEEVTAACLRLGPGDRLAEEVVGDVGRDDPERVQAVGREAAGTRIRNVGELTDRSEDAIPRRLDHVLVVVQNPGDGLV
jgi:hypothetical protein